MIVYNAYIIGGKVIEPKKRIYHYLTIILSYRNNLHKEIIFNNAQYYIMCCLSAQDYGKAAPSSRFQLKPAHSTESTLLNIIIPHACTNDTAARIFELCETLDKHNVIGKNSNSKRHRS